MNNSKKPLVSISCITFNQVLFIRKCLDGFMMQQCDFEFEILIHDDASTDGTSDIIKEYEAKYPAIIKPIYQKENQYSRGVRGINPRFNFPRAQGKYIAMCDGDDYWTDPFKLQKQVDILEKNSNISLVVGGYTVFNEITNLCTDKTIYEFDSLKSREFGFEFEMHDFLNRWITKTLTLFFRKSSINFNELKKYKYVRDVHINFYLLLSGNGIYIPQILGVYREHIGGVHSLIGEEQQQRNYYNVYKELFSFYPKILRSKYFSVLRALYYFQIYNDVLIIENSEIKRELIKIARTKYEVDELIKILKINKRYLKVLIHKFYKIIYK